MTTKRKTATRVALVAGVNLLAATSNSYAADHRQLQKPSAEIGFDKYGHVINAPYGLTQGKNYIYVAGDDNHDNSDCCKGTSPTFFA